MSYFCFSLKKLSVHRLNTNCHSYEQEDSFDGWIKGEKQKRSLGVNGKKKKIRHVGEIPIFWMWFLPHFVLKYSKYVSCLLWIFYWPIKSNGQLLRVGCIIPCSAPPSISQMGINWDQVLSDVSSVNINSVESCFKYTKLILITANEKRKNKTLL